MSQSTTTSRGVPAPQSEVGEVLQFGPQSEPRSPLDEIIHRGAQEMLQAAINAEVDEFYSSTAPSGMTRDDDMWFAMVAFRLARSLPVPVLLRSNNLVFVTTTRTRRSEFVSRPASFRST